MRPKLTQLLAMQVTLLALLGAGPSRAQPARLRALEGVRIARSGEEWDVTVAFNAPVQVRRHAPERRGETVRVELAWLSGPPGPQPRESLAAPREGGAPLESVSYEPGVGGFPVLELRFARPVDFELRQGRDLRSVVLRVRSAPAPRAGSDAGAGRAAPRAGSAAGTGRAAPPADARSAELVAEGRRALTAGEFERAALILQGALERPESDQTPESLELLGLARERKGQLAHAKAAYEDYLERFPDHEGAPRVRQRLDTLLTATTAGPLPPRQPPPAEPRRTAAEFELESYGSLYAGYRHESRILDGFGRESFDDSLFTDVYTDARLHTGYGTLRSHFAGGYRHQFAPDAGGSTTRVSSLYLGFDQPESGLSAWLGRRARSGAGVIGRLDGVELAWRGGERWQVGVLGGMPVDSSRWNGFETDRFLGGVNVELGTFFESLDVELYGVGQSASGLLDRAAIGGEARYFRDGLYAALFLDYDVHFLSLNVAQLTGSWQVTPATNLTALVDHRNVPFLTSRNALQGRAEGLAGLQDLFSDGEIESLAEDRTGRATTLGLGASHRLLPDLQLAFDFTASDYSGTDPSPDFPAFEGTGFEFSYLAQVIATDLVTRGDVGVASLRYFDGSNGDVTTFGLQARAPIARDLRVNPRFFTIYQKSRSAGEQVALRPSLRFDYRLWKLAFDLEGGIEWARGLGGRADPPWGYFTTFGVRYDF
jgi:hypothetical protein